MLIPSCISYCIRKVSRIHIYRRLESHNLPKLFLKVTQFPPCFYHSFRKCCSVIQIPHMWALVTKWIILLRSDLATGHLHVNASIVEQTMHNCVPTSLDNYKYILLKLWFSPVWLFNSEKKSYHFHLIFCLIK